MTLNHNEKLNERFKKVYGPITDTFFQNLSKLKMSDESLHCIPGLFLPSCGEKYEDSLVRIAIMGKETYGWTDTLKDNLHEAINGKYDLFMSQKEFRKTGPSEWKNPFWRYALSGIASMYGIDTLEVMSDKDSPILKSIAWNNAYNIESWSSKGVSDEHLTPEQMNDIQNLTDEFADIDKFIDVFNPHVIIQLFKNKADERSFRTVKKAKFVRTWGKDNIIEEYLYRGVIILRSRHSTNLRYNMKYREYGKIVREVLASHSLFKRLITMKHYEDIKDCEHIVRFAKELVSKYQDLDVKPLAQKIATSIAIELLKKTPEERYKKDQPVATMTAQCLIQIINKVLNFNAYSLVGRGPCAFIRGTYNSLVSPKYTEDADYVVLAYTGKYGNYLWKKD